MTSLTCSARMLAFDLKRTYEKRIAIRSIPSWSNGWTGAMAVVGDEGRRCRLGGRCLQLKSSGAIANQSRDARDVGTTNYYSIITIIYLEENLGQ